MAFNRVLEHCALKGWPDRRAAICNATRFQELCYQRLNIRLNDLVRREGILTSGWESYTNTEKMHARLQDEWSDEEERALRLSNSNYALMRIEIERLQAIGDPATLDGPFEMARRDPELRSAGSLLDSTVRSLDRELALES
jgi:hypothetical protein